MTPQLLMKIISYFLSFVQGTWYKCILALVFKRESQPLSLLSTACILWFGAGKSIILQSCTEFNKSKI